MISPSTKSSQGTVYIGIDEDGGEGGTDSKEGSLSVEDIKGIAGIHQENDFSLIILECQTNGVNGGLNQMLHLFTTVALT